MNEQLEKGILGIAQAYGPYTYWLENLFPGVNPDATWRALMVITALRDKAFVDQALTLLKSTDSRVRSWACNYLASVNHQPAAEKILALTYDPSPRVKYHARQALSMMQPENKVVPNQNRTMHGECTVLISSDSMRDCDMIAIMIRGRGFIPKIAYTEKDTISIAKQIKPNIVVTDNQKGKDNLSGLNMIWEFCREPELRETALIMLTHDQVEPIFLWQGGDLFLNKKQFNNPRLGGAQLIWTLNNFIR